jgi:hypothetical protein
MRFFILALLVFVLNIQQVVIAQDTTTSQAIYIEVLGNQFNQTYNYEYQIHYTKYWHIGLRAGIGAYHIKDFENKFNPDLLLPLAINGWFGNKHCIEGGIGQTLVSSVKYDISERQKNRAVSMHTQFNIGYRFQKNSGGFQFRALYAPFINNNKTFRHWGGFSVGYVFK